MYQLLQDFSSNQDAVQNIINQLVELDEVRRRAVEKSISNQDKVKKNFDKPSNPRSFQKGDTVLSWEKRREKLGKHGKFDSLWLGPFIIYDIVGTNSFLLNNMDRGKVYLSSKWETVEVVLQREHLMPIRASSVSGYS